MLACFCVTCLLVLTSLGWGTWRKNNPPSTSTKVESAGVAVDRVLPLVTGWMVVVTALCLVFSGGLPGLACLLTFVAISKIAALEKQVAALQLAHVS